MTRHTCQLNESNGFVCEPCDQKRERAVTEFDREHLPNLRALLKDMRLCRGAQDRIEDELLEAYVNARMEETNDDS